jgi:hypothetical protein
VADEQLTMPKDLAKSIEDLMDRLLEQSGPGPRGSKGEAIATIHIFEGDPGHNQPSHVMNSKRDGTKFAIVLNPVIDAKIAAEDGGPVPNKADVLAHEIGHAIAMLLKTEANRLSHLIGAVSPAEIEAWDLAGKMKNGVNCQIAQWAVGTYFSAQGADEKERIQALLQIGAAFDSLKASKAPSDQAQAGS